MWTAAAAKGSVAAPHRRARSDTTRAGRWLTSARRSAGWLPGPVFAAAVGTGAGALSYDRAAFVDDFDAPVRRQSPQIACDVPFDVGEGGETSAHVGGH